MINSLEWKIQELIYECKSPYNDGFTAWHYKQQLYKIKDLLDTSLPICPTFVGETEWLEENITKKETA